MEHREAGGRGAPEGVLWAAAAVLPRQGQSGSVANMAQSRDGGNPFPDPGELDNPFQVTSAGLLWPVYYSQVCGVGLLVPFVTFHPGEKCRYLEVTVARDQCAWESKGKWALPV